MAIRSTSLILALSSTALVLSPTAAQAQKAPAEQADSGEIIVTAQRREQSLLSVPLAITAVTGLTLTKTGVNDITSLRFNTPGFTSTSGTGYTQIYIRGIGNRIFVGADPSVATFIDDVPRIYAALVDDLVNVERVEVLKGAQGGLYGRNATGGVLNIISRQPTDELKVQARVSYGQKKSLDANVYVNVPLNENVAMNLVVSRKSHDDYVKNLATPNPYQSYAALSAAQATALGDTGQRAYLLANPALASRLDAPTQKGDTANQDQWYVEGKIRLQGDNFKVTLGADYSQNDDAAGNAFQSANPNKAFGIYRFLMGSTGPALFGGATGPAALPLAYYSPPQGKFETVSSIKSTTLQKDYGASAKVDIDLPIMTLSSISAFRWNSSRFRNDIGQGNAPLAGFSTNFRRRFVYQEVRMVSNGDGPFTWLAGATFFHEKIQNSLLSIVLGVEFPPTIATTKTNAFSGYAQGEYSVTDKLKLIGSVRYVTETKSALYPAQTVSIFNFAPNTPVAGQPQGLVRGVAVPQASGSTSVSKLLPSATISYELDTGGNIYARWARGLKTGGANPLVHPAQTLGTINAFKPEKVDTFEIGYKANLFDRRVQITTAAFYNDFRGLQVAKAGYTGLPFVLFNAGSAETYGAEVSVDWRVSPVFTLAANLGYLHARFKQFGSPGIPQLQVAAFNQSGQRLVQSPTWQGGATAALDMPITSQFNLAATVLYSFNSRYCTSDDCNPIVNQKAFSLVNTRVGIKTSDERYGLYLSVKNLFNKRYTLFGTSSPTSDYTIPGAPRIISGQIEVKF